MISVDIGDHRFQLRAAALFVVDGFVLLHRVEGDEYWALPGGRVEPGEDARTTIVREMAEELGEAIDCGPLLYLAECFFDGDNRAFHELGLYFRTTLSPASTLLDRTRSHEGIEDDKRLEFRWFAIDRLDDIDLHPTFLRQALALPDSQLRHFVQRD